MCAFNVINKPLKANWGWRGGGGGGLAANPQYLIIFSFMSGFMPLFWTFKLRSDVGNFAFYLVRQQFWLIFSRIGQICFPSIWSHCSKLKKVDARRRK